MSVKLSLTLLTHNWQLKLFSLLVATVMFFFVSVESATPLDVDFPIQYRLPNDFIITNDVPTLLNTTLRGPWAAFRTYDADDVKPVIIDVPTDEVDPGQPFPHTIELDEIDPPAGMTVVAVRPSRIDIEIDRKVEKVVAVEPQFLGRPAFGFEIENVVIEPPRVRVSGPAEKLQELDLVDTRPIDIRERQEDVSTEIALERPAVPNSRLVDRKAVRVLVDISEELMQRKIDVPVQLENAPPGATAAPARVELLLKGPRRHLDKLDSQAMVAFIDVAQEVAEGQRVFQKGFSLRPPLPERTQVVGDAPTIEISLTGRRRRR